MLVERLAEAGCVAPDEEASELVAAAPDEAILESWLRRRQTGEPLAWITGRLVFCGRPIRVDRGLYVPRYQTEELARRAVLALPPAGKAVDLCTGTGAIAAYLISERPAATVVAGDIDRRAAVCARGNGIAAVVTDLGDAFRACGAFDLVTAVAPYVPTGELSFLPRDVQRYEPIISLDGGPDGLNLVRRIVASAADLLRPGGWLFLEVGGSQDAALAPDLDRAGFTDIEASTDEDGDLRFLAARRFTRGHAAGRGTNDPAVSRPEA